MDVPKTDLRGKRCFVCGIKITQKNWAMHQSALNEKGIKEGYFCKKCFLKPESLNFNEKNKR